MKITFYGALAVVGVTLIILLIYAAYTKPQPPDEEAKG
jgi:hypothetical protein